MNLFLNSKEKSEDVVDALAEFLTDRRKQKIEEVLTHRTHQIVPVFDGLYDRGNVSAVIRSAEAMGYYRCHIIERGDAFKEANRVTQGADKWTVVSKWKSPEDCVKALKESGHRIISTSLESDLDIHEVDFTEPSAIVFGNEKDGVSETVLKASHSVCRFPMQGFTQSFNISVAAALCLQHIVRDRIERQGFHGDLNWQERQKLRAHYYLKSVPHAREIVSRHQSEVK